MPDTAVAQTSSRPTWLRRLVRPLWPWAVVAVIAVAFVVVGLQWVDGKDMRTGARETWAQRAIIAAGLGLFVVEALRRLRWWLGAAALVLLAVGTFLVLDQIIDEVRVESYSGSQRRELATAELLPVGAVPEGSVAPSPLVDDPMVFEDLDLELVPFVEGLEQPVALEPIPGTDQYFALERTGGVLVVESDGSVGAEVLDLSSMTTLDGERGMLDLAVDPDGDRLYVSYTDPSGDNQVDSYAIGSDLTLTDRWDVISVTQPFETHNGGAIAFDLDGYLVMGVGDGGRLRDSLDAGQDRTNRLGTLLRILPAEGGDYLIPPDNPYVDDDDVWPEIYAYGLRNPWRFTFDPATGDLWIGDVGQDHSEEVDRLPYGHTGGANFGWNRVEGTEVHVGKPNAPTGFTEVDIPADHVPPVFTYDHDPEGLEGSRNSITGGPVYRGAAIPELWGAYLYADWAAGTVSGLLVDESGAPVTSTDFLTEVPAPVAFGVDHDGEVLVISIGGEIGRLEAA